MRLLVGGARVLAAVFVAALLIVAPAQARSPAACGPGDRQEPALQGQVPVADRLSGAAEPGYNCNLELVGGYAGHSFANFDTYRNCAYYTDNAGGLSDEAGGVVLDVSDPAHPVKTAYLKSRAMGDAGEALRVNHARGLLVAVHYNASGIDPRPIHHAIAVYDISKDCAHPKLLADELMPDARGHEGCFQPDGMVFYMSNMADITPIDLTDPRHPKQLSKPWSLAVHGCSISDDGKRGYFGSFYGGEMLTVDTSQVQARIPGAQPRVIASFPTPDAYAQQSTLQLRYHGHPYVYDWSEATGHPKLCTPGQSTFGYGRFLDVADEAHPKEVSKVQTEVMKPENCPQVAADLSLQSGGLAQGDPSGPVATLLFQYDTHQCTPDRLHDPTILACASFGSGLRVFDIRDPRAPKEIAYYNTGTASKSDPALDWAFARPVIRRDLGEIWWATTLEGFHVAKFRDGVWPFRGMNPCPAGYDYYQDQYDLKYRSCGSGHHPRRRAHARQHRARRRHPARRRGTAQRRSVQPARYSQTGAAIGLATRAAQQDALLCHLLPTGTTAATSQRAEPNPSRDRR